jgi:site-specific DNA-methyltransferase (adenine-specific)
MIKLYKGDCLIKSDKIESGSVDLILTDLPYGTMKGAENSNIYGSKDIPKHEWDNVIDTNKIMQIANRILRKNGKMVLFAQDPFSTELKTKAIPNLPYNYSFIWEKDTFAFALIAKKAPVNYYEDVLVFSKSNEAIPPHDFEGNHPLRDYFKIVMEFIGLNLKQINSKLGHRRAEHTFYINSTQYALCTSKTYKQLVDVFQIDRLIDFKNFSELKKIDDDFKKSKETERLDYLEKHNKKYPSTFNLWEGKKYKSNILKYKKDYTGHHPTQKPVLLLEDLIKTFSNENDLVVDLTMGSGSTGVACVNTNRSFIGIEMDSNYFEISTNRINQAKTDEYYSLKL